VLGPAVYGNYVVIGAGSSIYIYKLGPTYRVRVPDLVVPWWERLFPVPPPPPDPFVRELAERIANALKR
jgi:hypothetical protein